MRTVFAIVPNGYELLPHSQGTVGGVMADDSRALLRSVLDGLGQLDPFPDGSDAVAEDAWVDRVEAEADLAGLIATALAPGRVDRQALASARSMIGKAGSRVDDARLANAFRILLQSV